MFERLSEKVSNIFRNIGSRQFTEENIQEGLREIRLALLEADVNITVVKDFIDNIQKQLVGHSVKKGLTPMQHLIQVVHAELTEVLGGKAIPLQLHDASPAVVMLVGLQGSGKTTSTGKLAKLLHSQGMRPYLVPVDVYRPAAIDQLKALGQQLEIPCYPSTVDMQPVDIVTAALKEAKEHEYNVLLLDTAGRLHIDTKLMEEIRILSSVAKPQEILFVADAMTGQDAVTVAGEFNKVTPLTGAIFTKIDGDARGGAALSIRASTGVAIKFVGTGEKLSDFETFHPERIAGRILGMGDMLTLIERAEAVYSEKEAQALAEKVQKSFFSFEDFLYQIRKMKQIGSISSFMKLLPGVAGAAGKANKMKLPEEEMKKTEAVISSMTVYERQNPNVLNGSRKQRIAKGAGVTINQVNQVIAQFEKMKGMLERVAQTMPNVSGEGKAPPPELMSALSKVSRFLPGMPGLFRAGVEDTHLERTGASSTKGSATKVSMSKKKQKERQKRKNKKRK